MKQKEFEQLFRHKSHILKKYLLKLGSSREDAEDIIQEVVYKTLLYVDSIPHEKLSSWMFTVATNQYYNMYNSQKRMKITMNDSVIPFLIEGKSPEQVILSQELGEKVNDVLSNMKESYKQLLILKYEFEMTYNEIADLLGISEKHVKTYLFRARNKFREMWEGVQYE